MKLRICGQDVSIVHTPRNQRTGDQMGFSSIKECKIALEKNMPRGAMESTLLHEVLHYIACSNSMLDMRLCEEGTISILANALLSFVKDNKSVVRKLLEQ